MIEPDHPDLSIGQQCKLLSIARASCYYEPKGETEQNLGLMRRLMRLMRLMGLMAIYQQPNTSRPTKGHKTYPYLLRDLRMDRPNQVWCSDITYIPMCRIRHRARTDGASIAHSSTSWRSWTGTSARFCPGGSRTPWRPLFAAIDPPDRLRDASTLRRRVERGHSRRQHSATSSDTTMDRLRSLNLIGVFGKRAKKRHQISWCR